MSQRGESADTFQTEAAAENQRLREEVARLREASKALRWARAAADAVTEATLSVSPDGIIVDLNQATCDMHGRTREELIGRPIAFLHAPGAPRFDEINPGFLRERRADFRAIHRRRDDTTFPVHVRLSAVEIDGEWKSVGVVRDLSEQARHEALVRTIARGVSATSGREFFRTLLEHLAPAIGADHAFVGEFVPGPVPRVRMIANLTPTGHAALLEYELAGTPCENVVGREVCAWADGIQAAFPADTWLAENGAHGYAGVPLTRSDGQPLGLMAMTTSRPLSDVARVESLLQIFAARAAAELERLQSEQARLRSEALLRDVIERSPVIVVVKDLEGRLLLANRALEPFTGRSLPDMLGTPLHDHFEPAMAAGMRANDREVVAGGSPVQFELEVPHRDGRPRSFLIQKMPLLDPSGAAYAVCSVASDITDHKAIEARLRDIQRLESVGVLAGGVAHDFNNLLTAIQGYTDLAIQEAGEDSGVARLLGEAQSASRRAAGLTRQLLAFARRQALAPRRVELHPAIDEVVALLRPLTGERIRVTVLLPASLWAVHADPGQLEQVLVHLMVNARDAMPAGGEITFAAENLTLSGGDAPPGSDLAAGDYVALWVRDTGAGMSPDVLSRVFDPFFTTKGPGRGAGIGLATCHGIVRQGGGHIWATSEPGQGATFHLLLPRGAEAADSAPEAGGAAAGGRILLVEDEALVRTLAARTLRAAGYRVFEAATATEALGRLEAEGPPDLMLTDVVMPGLSGAELAERVRALHPELPIVFTSGFADDALRERARTEQIALLDKPYAPSALVAAVRGALLAR